MNQENISEQEWKAAKVQAGGWTTCACGNLCAIIPRNSEGKPYDKLLANLGGNYSEGIEGFSYCIEKRDKEAAKNILALIEVRAAYLIKKEKERIIKEFDAARQKMIDAGMQPV